MSASIDIHRIATLARLKLTEEEAASYEAQLGRILEYVDTLSRYDLNASQPTAHTMPVFDVLRVDEVREGLPQSATLSNAPRKAMDQFQIPKVVE
jgi:aspartyl-tRNA(Asn)/glutamyl-tRNA(Gln) amidotransferase subunit C